MKEEKIGMPLWMTNETQKRINHTIDKDHKDFQLLKDIFAISNVYDSSTISCGKTTKRHYIREYGFRYWDTAEGYEKTKSIQSNIVKFNELSSDYEMYFVDTTDYEMEYDKDRDWPASWSCGFKKK